MDLSGFYRTEWRSSVETKISIKLPETLRRRAKAVAALRDETISDVIRIALEEYLEKSIASSEDFRLVYEMEARMDQSDDDVIEWD